eukprot:COSAG06_NODE_6635_length_2845_cov_2.705497_3_plen_137_part_00
MWDSLRPGAVAIVGRESLTLNIGGYRGAPDTGEFAAVTVMENHTGQSGPRTELLELLDWLWRLRRRRQRFLGFKESKLTYLYDIPVWEVDNVRGCAKCALCFTARIHRIILLILVGRQVSRSRTLCRSRHHGTRCG